MCAISSKSFHWDSSESEGKRQTWADSFTKCVALVMYVFEFVFSLVLG